MSLGNLWARVVAILLVGFIAWQLLIVLATSLPSRGSDARPYGLPRPADAAAMIGAIERAPSPERAKLIDLFNQGLYSVQLAPEGVSPSPNATTDDLVTLGRYYAAAMPGRAVAVDARRPFLGTLLGSRPRPARFFAPVRIMISLNDGDALVLTSRPAPALRNFLRRRSLLGALGGLVLLGILMLAMRQAMRPIVRLSGGVRAFGHDLRTNDLAVEGPAEVRDLARAFNEMKRRIAALMSERTRTLAAIAHDMRTYLTRLRLRVEYIEDAGHRERAVRDLDEMAALLDDTLMLASADAPGTEPAPVIDLRAHVEAVLAAREVVPERLHIALADGPIHVRARPLAVRRILDNLLDNGLRYAGQVTVALERRAGQAILAVSDDGPGIAPEWLDRLGEPFVRPDPSRNRDSGGAGLGLAIVRALATQDGAELHFANRPTGGLLVTLCYPVVPEPEEPAA